MKQSVRLFDLRARRYCSVPDVPFVVALGNFDGVHTAHHVLLLRAVRTAHEYSKSKKTYSAAWLFDPPSSDFFTNKIEHLTTLDEKLELFAACGLDYAFIADFSALRECSPEDFIREALLSDAHAVHAVCGFHFNFGKGGTGNTSLLKAVLGEDRVDIIPPIYTYANGQETVISSTATRAALVKGDVRTAASLLGRPYQISAPVKHGKQLARTLGLPTINQDFPALKCIPAPGIYATLCRINGTSVYGVSNVGTRPTTDGYNTHINCETHLIDFCDDVYGQTVTVSFIERLRDEKPFSCVEELKEAIVNDVSKCKVFFKLR